MADHKGRKRRSNAPSLSPLIARQWTVDLVADGFAAISVYFLENYHRLDISSVEAMFIIQLMRHKWDEKPPHPSFKSLAKRMGVKDPTVRMYARDLEGKMLLKRVNRYGQPINEVRRTGEPNRFDLNPLFQALEKLRAADMEAPVQDRQGEHEAP